MTYREFIQRMKRYWIGKRVIYGDIAYKVVDVDYNGMLMIDKPTQFTETTAVDPLMIDPTFTLPEE